MVSSAIRHQRCFLHPGREAVARCPECRRYFCRECVTEHEDRLLCASCLAKTASGGSRRPAAWRPVIRAVAFTAGFLLCWLCFYYLGQLLLQLPDSFHQTAIWEDR